MDTGDMSGYEGDMSGYNIVCVYNVHVPPKLAILPILDEGTALSFACDVSYR